MFDVDDGVSGGMPLGGPHVSLDGDVLRTFQFTEQAQLEIKENETSKIVYHIDTTQGKNINRL